MPVGYVYRQVVSLCPPHTRGESAHANHATPQSCHTSASGYFRLQVSTLELGSQDEDYPFACPPGTVGGTEKDVKTQLSHVCSGACPAGSICNSATRTPQRKPHEGSNLKKLVSITQRRSTIHSILLARVVQLARLAHIARTVRPRAHSVRQGVRVPVRISRRQRSATNAPQVITA